VNDRIGIVPHSSSVKKELVWDEVPTHLLPNHIKAEAQHALYYVFAAFFVLLILYQILHWYLKNYISHITDDEDKSK
jgi:hypothetical protein